MSAEGRGGIDNSVHKRDSRQWSNSLWLFGLAGIFAGAILATAFLPVFYGHFALNDSPLLLPMAIALVGVAMAFDSGSQPGYALAAIGVGLAAATKYTAAIVGLALAVTIATRFRQDGWRPMLTCAVLTPLAFFVANPYAVFDHQAFVAAVRYQHSISAGESVKVGQIGSGGVTCYLGSLTWGLGWVPLAAAVVGSIVVIRRDLRRAADGCSDRTGS